jgi:hypothetical protein
MAVLTSVLISLVAWLIGAQADVTFWRTETAWVTKPAATVWNTETYTETAYHTKIYTEIYTPPAVTISIPYTVTSILEKDHTDIKTTTISIPYTVTSILEKDHTDTLTTTAVSITTV